MNIPPIFKHRFKNNGSGGNIQENQSFVKRSPNVLPYFFYLVVLFFILYVFYVPKATIGEIFFGRIPALYNLSFSKFFYNQALLFDTKNKIPRRYVHYQLGRIAFIEGNFPKTLDEMSEEIRYYPDTYQVYYMKGLTLGYTNREREAIENFKIFVEHNSDKWAGRNDLAWLQFRIGDIDGALTTITPAYTKYPDNPWVLNTYGTLLMNKGNYQEAKKVLEKGHSISQLFTEKEWGIAYPGNDPRIYTVGLQAMRDSFASNLELLDRRSKEK